MSETDPGIKMPDNASEPEFSRIYKTRPLPGAIVELEANEAERLALTERLGIARIDSLSATLSLAETGKAITAKGTLNAAIVQNCAVSLEEFPVEIREKLDLRFVSPYEYSDEPDDEIELSTEDLDEIEFTGDSFDLGEAVAQTLGLAIDAYAVGPNADAVRAEAGLLDEQKSGAFGGLADLLKS